MKGADVVFTYSYVSWQAAAERGWFMPEDRLAKALVSHERVERLLISDLMRSLPVKLLRDGVSALRSDRYPFPTSTSRQLLRPVRLRREYPTSIAGVRRACAAYDRVLERRARRMGMREPVLITANPLMAGFAEFAWAGSVTYFAHDDWLAYPLHERWWPAYEASFAQVRARGRRVCAVSQAALERIAPSGSSAVVPNGLDPTEWEGPAPPPPSWAPRARRPLLLYVGSLDSRLDVPALARLARELPESEIALVGPLLDDPHLAPLRGQANVKIHPALAREQVAGLIRSADVGLVPHVDSALTRAMSPLKLYEYLAGGLPVVAGDLQPMRGVDPGVVLVEPGGDFAGGVRQALARGRASEDARRAFIAEHSWASRQETLLDLALA
ncbi:MAG TPA: glycosyltransferase [Solirubrobacteraceae bacterium]|nr:glycosyltransferase [Solirubrobacteraceae bacterium]